MFDPKTYCKNMRLTTPASLLIIRHLYIRESSEFPRSHSHLNKFMYVFRNDHEAIFCFAVDESFLQLESVNSLHSQRVMYTCV